MKQYKNVNELWGAIVNGDMDPSVLIFRNRSVLYLSDNAISKLH